MVQGALVRAWSKIRSLEAESAISVWLYRIVQSVAGERTRKARSRVRAMKRMHDSRDPAPAGGTTPHGADELAEVVRVFMRELSDRQRAMMDLVDLQGMAPSEAARMLDINESTARVHLLRARRRIRARILKSAPDLMEPLP